MRRFISICCLLLLPALAETNETELVRQAYCAAITAEDKTTKSKAKAALGKLGIERIRILIEHVHVNNMYIRFDLDSLVRRHKQDAAPYLQAGLTSEHERTRRYAAYYLGFTPPGDPTSLYPLLDDKETAGVAMRTLGKWAVTNAVPKIIPHLEHEDERVRIRAVNALRDIGDSTVANQLIPLLASQPFTVRYAAERALAALGNETVPVLLKALRKPKTPAQRHIIRALGEIGDKRALPKLRQLTASAGTNWGLLGDLRRAKAAIKGEELQALAFPAHPFLNESGE